MGRFAWTATRRAAAALLAAALAFAPACGDSKGDDDDVDVDAASLCGNGTLDPGEDCDPAIDSGCTDTCVLACGDGLVQADEECDTAIPAGEDGVCPADPAADCDDGMACTQNLIAGSECLAVCENPVIDAFIDNDGCCPAIAENIAFNDFDCAPVCGNGLVEMGETCDTGVTAGEPGACPTDCDDGVACTDDTLVVPDDNEPGDGACRAVCEHTERTVVMNGDGCCPADATNATDDDCVAAPTCGNGNFNPGQGESCDTAIAAGMNGACPTECPMTDPCVNTLLVSANTCSAQCVDIPIDHPANGDSCCPVFDGANNRNDDDCTTSCGTPAEECDTPGVGDCDANCRIVRTAFRVTSITIQDPHIYWDIGTGNCADLTSTVNNNILPDTISGDDDGDGYADLTILNVFKPIDRGAATNVMDIVFGKCTPGAPAEAECSADPLDGRIPAGANNMDTGTCLGALPMTLTDAYMTPPDEPVGPCFVSDSFTGDLQLGSLTVPLEDAYIAATYNGDPADGLVDGLIRGFVSEQAAMDALIPDDVLLVGGMQLYELLAGGIAPGSCTVNMVPIGDDRDVGPDGTTSGWYFYVNFTAALVPFDDKPNAGN